MSHDPHTRLLRTTPYAWVNHFKNAAAKARVKGGATPLESDFIKVPLYRGASRWVMKQVLAHRKYQKKLASPGWKFGAYMRKQRELAPA
jgi:hypothetical protein